MSGVTETSICLDSLLCACGTVAVRAAEAIARSNELCHEALHLQRCSSEARLSSRPHRRYARVEGIVAGTKVISVVRRDASLALGTRTLAARLSHTSGYDPGGDPLMAALTLARECDRVLAVHFERAGARPNVPDIGATACERSPMEDPWIASIALGESFAMEVIDGYVGQHVVCLRGELDVSNADRVRDTLIGVAGSTVVADLSGLSFIDAGGLAALVAAKQRISADGHTLRITGAKQFVRRVFHLGELDELLDD